MIQVAFIKDSIVMDILLFDNSQDNTELIASIVEANNYDTAIELQDTATPRYSTWNGIKFVETPQQVLHQLGVVTYVEPTETTD